MSRCTRPLIALLAVASACSGAIDPSADDPGSLAAALGTPTPTAFDGVYILTGATLDPSTVTDISTRTFVDGVALRTAWNVLDTGTMGAAYDFSSVSDAIAQLSSAGKKLTIGIDAQLVPPYVLTAAHAAGNTYMTTVPGPGNTNYPAETPVTWDPGTLASYTSFMTALGNLSLCKVGTTCSPNQMVALKDHPTLAGVRINILGIGKLRQSAGAAMFLLPSYNRNTFINAVNSNIHAAHNQLVGHVQNVASWIPYFSLDDSASGTSQTQSLDEALIAAITAEFNGSTSLRPTLGFFQELLKGDSPNSTVTMGLNLLSAKAQGGFVTFQACGGWTNQSLCTFSPGDTTPENGFDLGYGTYGTQYYEMYTGDLTNSGLASMFTTWSAFVKAPATASNPIALVASPAGSTKNSLSWTDTSTIETSWIVERRVTTGNMWMTQAMLVADTTAYVDTILRNTSYVYRVHAVGTAGTFPLSNESTVTR